ncbi:MAG: response regulator [Vicinamibacterales bacterium]
MTGTPIRVVLADDHTLVRAGIRRILEGQAGFEVVAEASTGADAVALVGRHAPDVLVLDVSMPDGDGIEVLRTLRQAPPARPPRIVVLTMYAGREYVARAMREGADAYLLKDSAVQDLVAAVRAVMAGRRYFSPAVQAVMADWVGGRSNAGPQGLTEREREVLEWLARGCSSREVAGHLSISVRTVETHRANLMQKLDVKSVATLIQVAIREGLISPPAPQ